MNTSKLSTFAWAWVSVPKCSAQFRFYEELNDFLPIEKRKVQFTQTFVARSSIKDVIESLGVPHTEIDLIIVNGTSVDFSYQIKNNDHVSVYPTFELFDISPLVKLRPAPLRKTKFILDVHLGKLARYLRLLGFDTAYATDYQDKEIINIAVEQKRIVLTRDVGLLKNKKVTHGYFLRETNPKKQVQEVLQYFGLRRQINAFTRCLECNGIIVVIDKNHAAIANAPPRVRQSQDDFYQCLSCLRLYWQGTHYRKLAEFVQSIKD